MTMCKVKDTDKEQADYGRFYKLIFIFSKKQIDKIWLQKQSTSVEEDNTIIQFPWGI